MLEVKQAQARILDELSPLPVEHVSLHQALGRILAEDIVSPLDLPPFPNSSMDGYAVRAADVAAASAKTPIQLHVVADIAAGHVPDIQLGTGQAARIMTGAPLPAGADSVIPVEQTDDKLSFTGADMPAQVDILQGTMSGAYVRFAGEDVQSGEHVLAVHTHISPAIVGVLAALGVAAVPVFRRPRIAILGTGDEIVEVDEPLGPGQIRNVNGYTLAALVEQYGAEPIVLGVARDSVAAVTERLNTAIDENADLILTSAGVSMGATDVVRLALEQDGNLQFWRVNMRPGKPVAFGQYRGTPLLGLPGNPVSSIVTCEVFARPAILKLAGYAVTDHPEVRVRIQEAIQSDGRETYFRAIVEYDSVSAIYTARSAGGQGSHMLRVLSHANALVIIPADVREIEAGRELAAWLLGDISIN